MSVSKLRPLLLFAGIIGTTVPIAIAAQNPTPAQAQQMLQQNPALLQQLRQRIISSGLTPDQVRARLRAEGYPENLLDAYLPGATGGADTTVSSEDVFSAISQLGIVDTTDISLIRCGIDPDSLAVSDTLANGMVDTTRNRTRIAEQRRIARARCIE